MIVDLYNVHFKEININNRVYNYYFDYLMNAKNLESKNTLVNERNYKDLIICFTRYDREKPIRMLSLYFHELVWKTGI